MFVSPHTHPVWALSALSEPRRATQAVNVTRCPLTHSHPSYFLLLFMRCYSLVLFFSRVLCLPRIAALHSGDSFVFAW